MSVVCCVTFGHEAVPAFARGTYDDGDYSEAGIAYCAECAEVMKEWTLTEALHVFDALHPVPPEAPEEGT